MIIFCSLNFEPKRACRLLARTGECAVCYTHKRTRYNVMSAQKQTSAHVRVMSASPPKADIRLFDYLVVACQRYGSSDDAVAGNGRRSAKHGGMSVDDDYSSPARRKASR